MRIISVQNTVMFVIGSSRIPLVTLETPKMAMKAVKWTRTKETAIEGASALLDYCNGKGMKPKGRKLSKKACIELAGTRYNYK